MRSGCSSRGAWWGVSRPGRTATLPGRPAQDSVYIFRDGALPPYRQMFYQLCDLNVDE